VTSVGFYSIWYCRYAFLYSNNLTDLVMVPEHAPYLSVLLLSLLLWLLFQYTKLVLWRVPPVAYAVFILGLFSLHCTLLTFRQDYIGPCSSDGATSTFPWAFLFEYVVLNFIFFSLIMQYVNFNRTLFEWAVFTLRHAPLYECACLQWDQYRKPKQCRRLFVYKNHNSRCNSPALWWIRTSCSRHISLRIDFPWQ